MAAFKTAVVAMSLFAVGAAHAASVDVSFTRISSNASVNVESQFLATATTVAGDTSVVDFIIRNNVGVASSISEIYFDNGAVSSLFSTGSIVEQVGTNFVFGSASPPDLPGGDSLTHPFNVTVSFLADAKGNPNIGVNTATDLVRIRFALLGGVMFDDVADALADGSLRIGFHVRSIGEDEDSDAFVSTSIVPLPGPGALGTAGLLAALGVRRRRG